MRRKGQTCIRAGGLPDRILDLLEIDGGWWQAAELATYLRASDETTRRALYRLRDRGYVASRPISRRPDRRGQAPGEWRLEWRAAKQPA